MADDRTDSYFLEEAGTRARSRVYWSTLAISLSWFSTRLLLRYYVVGVPPIEGEQEIFIVSTDLSGLMQTQVSVTCDQTSLFETQFINEDIFCSLCTGKDSYYCCTSEGGTKSRDSLYSRPMHVRPSPNIGPKLRATTALPELVLQSVLVAHTYVIARFFQKSLQINLRQSTLAADIIQMWHSICLYSSYERVPSCQWKFKAFVLMDAEDDSDAIDFLSLIHI